MVFSEQCDFCQGKLLSGQKVPLHFPRLSHVLPKQHYGQFRHREHLACQPMSCLRTIDSVQSHITPRLILASFKFGRCQV